MPTPEQIDAAIRTVAPRFDGSSGNCARFAATLNKVLQGDGNYLLVESGHYEYSDHVYLCHQDFYFDSDGLIGRGGIEEIYPSSREADEDEDEDEEDDGEYYVEESFTLEDFHDPSPNGDLIRRAVDSSNPLAAQWDDADLEEALAEAFAAMGCDMPWATAAR